MSPPFSIQVSPLVEADREAWEPLARAYKAFYGTATTDAEYDRAWQRLLAQDGLFGLAARIDSSIVGVSHHLFHTSTWAPTVCYLQDMFTAPEFRGRGVGRALIDAVAEHARQRGAVRYYWLTQEHNALARHLYEKVGRFNGFIRYDYSL